MKLKKKVLTSTLAAGLVISSISGLPLSSKGVFDKLGVSVAHADGLPASANYLKLRMVKVYDAMSADDKAIVQAASTQVQGLKNAYPSFDAANLNLIAPVWTEIAGKIGTDAALYPAVTQENVLYLFLHLALNYDTQLTFWESARTNPILRPVADQLLKLGGIDDGIDGVGFEDVEHLAKGLEKSVKDTLNGEYDPLKLLSKRTQLKEAVKQYLSTSTGVLETALRNSGVTSNAALAVLNNFEGRFDKLIDAEVAIASAYLKVLSDENPTGGNPPGGNPNPGSGPSTPSDGGTTTPVETPATVEEALKVIEAAKEKLDDATEAEKAKLIAEAVKTAQEAIDKLATVDLSKSVKVEGDVAKLEIDAAALKKQLEDIAAQVKKLNDQLKELDSSVSPLVVELKLDLGKNEAATTEVPLLKELLDAAKDNGVDAVVVKVNGVELAISPELFAADTTLTVGKVDKSSVNVATYGSFASDVYSFEFTSGGQAVTNFSTPVEVRIPVTAKNVDTELLTIAKIVDGSLQFVGGMYNAGTGSINGLRSSFSTYTVVENKVSFNDVASVKDWAGRQIDVVAAKGIVEGRADQEFVPNEKVTRAEFTKMIVKALGIEDVNASESFTDVDNLDWHKAAVATAVKYGIVNGRTDDKFEPNATITRAEMATIASRALTIAKDYAAVSDVDAALKAFIDAAAINESLKAGVALAAKEGIVIGEAGGQFNPNSDSTRAQAAVVIYRLLNK